MLREELKAKVFISCGQHTCEERAIAREIEEALRCEGYDPYVAVQKQTLRDLRHNIFKELEDSEYIVLVDFKREALVPEDADLKQSVGQFLEGCRCQWRGSLFCHQELAAASYLDLGTDQDMEILAFHEKGVKTQDGMMSALQVNSQEFTDPGCLPKLIACHARNKWKHHWKNQLRLCRDPERHGLAVVNGENIEFFHVSVRNLHKRKPAFNCYVYLEKVIDLSTNTPISVPTIEFKWAGVMRANVLILPHSCRDFDALLINHEEPRRPRFNVFADSPHFEPQIQNCTEAELTYVVVSENFPLARLTCRLHIDDDPQKTSLEPVDTTPLDSKTCETPDKLPPSELSGGSSTSAMLM